MPLWALVKNLSIMVFEGIDQNYLLGQLLRIVRAKLKELKFGQRNYTATILLAGIPNVGKSVIANSMHQIGRIGAAGAPSTIDYEILIFFSLFLFLYASM